MRRSPHEGGAVADEHKTGRFLGPPYDWRRPTPERLKGASGTPPIGEYSSRRSTGGATASTSTR
jgi:hypothetical protein